MEAYLEQAWRHANIPAELANLRPCGDFVLVRVIPEPEMAGRIVLPQGRKENLAPRIGEVIAVGPGDKLPLSNKEMRQLADADGGIVRPWADEIVYEVRADIWWTRGPMHVKPGDRILYWRTYANEVVLNDELYQLIHEEQHIVGVLEN